MFYFFFKYIYFTCLYFYVLDLSVFMKNLSPYKSYMNKIIIIVFIIIFISIIII